MGVPLTRPFEASDRPGRQCAVEDPELVGERGAAPAVSLELVEVARSDRSVRQLAAGVREPDRRGVRHDHERDATRPPRAVRAKRRRCSQAGRLTVRHARTPRSGESRRRGRPGRRRSLTVESGGVGPGELANELTFQAPASQTSETTCVRHDCCGWTVAPLPTMPTYQTAIVASADEKRSTR